MGPEIYSAVSIVGDARFDPDEVTALTGLTPTRSWRVGDRMARRHADHPPQTTAAWWFQVGPTLSVELPNQVEGLLSQFEPHVMGLKEITSRSGAEVEVSVHVYMADQTPIGTFERSLLQRIVALGAHLDVDLYVVEQDYFRDR